MKKVLFIAMLSALFTSSLADTIRTRKGEVITGTVIEVGKTEIKYTYPGKTKPMYVLDLKEIDSIEYEDGRTDRFVANANSEEEESNEKQILKQLKIIKWTTLTSASITVLTVLYTLTTRF